MSTSSARHHLANTKRAGVVTALVGVIAVGGVAVVAGNDPAKAHPDETVSAATTAIEEVLATGTTPTGKAMADLASSSSLRSVGAELSRAKVITAPAGGSSGQTWIVSPAVAGRACLTIEGGSVCGTAHDIVSAGIAGMRVSQPTTRLARAHGGAAVLAPGGRADITGIAPRGAKAITALDASGQPTARATTAGLAYRLQVPTEDLATLSFSDAAGNILAVKAIK